MGKIAPTFQAATVLAISYIALFYLPDAMMGNYYVMEFAGLIFLPAFIRLLGFLMIGFWIIPTLLVSDVYLAVMGKLNFAPGLQGDLIIAAMISVGGPLGVAAAANLTKLKSSLSNLTPLRLLVLSFGCSFGNALFHHLGMRFIGQSEAISSGTVGIFLGDMIGSWTIIYLLKGLLTLAGRSLK